MRGFATRCKTAREAIALIDNLMQTYGYASSERSFTIADPDEVWIMEIMAKAPRMVEGKNVNKGAVWVAKPDCGRVHQCPCQPGPHNNPGFQRSGQLPLQPRCHLARQGNWNFSGR